MVAGYHLNICSVKVIGMFTDHLHLKVQVYGLGRVVITSEGACACTSTIESMFIAIQGLFRLVAILSYLSQHNIRLLASPHTVRLVLTTIMMESGVFLSPPNDIKPD